MLPNQPPGQGRPPQGMPPQGQMPQGMSPSGQPPSPEGQGAERGQVIEAIKQVLQRVKSMADQHGIDLAQIMAEMGSGQGQPSRPMPPPPAPPSAPPM